MRLPDGFWGYVGIAMGIGNKKTRIRQSRLIHDKFLV